jgi:outer membrane lipoprotein
MKYLTVISVVAFCLVLFTAGCAHVISPEAMKGVDSSIRFEKLQENPETYRGTRVLLGGDIIETGNYPDRTLIVVLQKSLDYRKRPVSGGASGGRFVVTHPEFLDPAVYRPKRKLTVVGEVMGKDTGVLGGTDEAYPLIQTRELYIWPVVHPSTGQPEIRIDGQMGIGVIIFRRN